MVYVHVSCAFPRNISHFQPTSICVAFHLQMYLYTHQWMEYHCRVCCCSSCGKLIYHLS